MSIHTHPMRDPQAAPPLVELTACGWRAGERQVLRDITWRLEPGQHWALLGPNGAGKSSFLRLVRGEVWPATEDTHRRLYHDAQGPGRPSPIGFKERTRLVSVRQYQQYLLRMPRLVTRRIVAAGFHDAVGLSLELDPAQAARVAHLGRALGLEDLWDRRFNQLSQGQAMRVLLARALAQPPAVLFLDEVCEGLDARYRQGLVELLAAEQAQGMQLIWAGHTMELMPLTTHVARLADGRLDWQGTVEDWRQSRSRPATARAAAPDPSPDDPQGPPWVELAGVEVYLDHHKVLGPVDWRWDQGRNWAVVGPNGAGKTTLLRLISGDHLPAWGGRVRRPGLGEPRGLWELRGRIGYVSARLQALHRYAQTGREVVVSGFFGSRGLHVEPTEAQWERADRCLAELGLTRLADRQINTLSHGQFRQLLLARALAHDPRLLLLDEPLGGLDPQARVEYLERLESLMAGGVGVMVVTHYLDELPEGFDMVLEMEAGLVVRQGTRSRPPLPGQ